MSPLVIILLVSSVFVLGHCKGDSEAKKALEDEIKEMKEDIVKVNQASDKLRKEIKTEAHQYEAKVRISERLRKRGNVANTAQHKVLEDLYRKLAKLKVTADQLKEAPENIEKLKLGIKVKEENIKILQERRENGMTKSCLQLEGMASKGRDAKASLLSMTRVEDTIVLENQRRLVKSELQQAKYTNLELIRKLKSLIDYYEKYNQELNEVLEVNGENYKKGEESIEKVKKALAEQQKVVDQLSETTTSKAELDRWEKEGRRVLEKYQRYALDVECYKKLQDDVVALTDKP